MEFKRIDDTKFQCLLDEDDLEDNNISLDDFFRNDTKKIHGLLDVILEEAQKSIGIMMDGGVMSLQRHHSQIIPSCSLFRPDTMNSAI